LKQTSSLKSEVKVGIGAFLGGDRRFIQEAIRDPLRGFFNLDAAFASANPQANRWDYLPRRPNDSENCRSRAAFREAERGLCRHREEEGCSGTVATALASRFSSRCMVLGCVGDVHFPIPIRNEKRLAQENITFVGKQLKAKHLPK